MPTDTLLLQIDTLTQTAQQIRYSGDAIPLTQQTEPWVFICLMGLLGLLVFIVALLSSSLVRTFKAFFETGKRVEDFNTSTNSFSTRFFSAVFYTGVLGFLVYLHFQPDNAGFPLITYLYFWGITAAFFCFKSILFSLLGFVFLRKSVLRVAKEVYFSTFALLGIILYPILVIRVYVLPILDYKIIDSVVLFLFLAAFLFIVYKLFRIFFSKPVDSFYILLYLCTLEILPFVVLFQLYKTVV